MRKLLIGSTGLIGRALQQHTVFDTAVHSSDIDVIANRHFDLAVCAAPSGNRINAVLNPQQDSDSVKKLVEHIAQSKIQRMILISSCDTQARPDSVYGKNRLFLEMFVKSYFDNYAIIRLPSLIDHSLTKNILFDLKHRVFLDKINPHSYMQWYPLPKLSAFINTLPSDKNIEFNLCSVPIGNWEIIDRFASDIKCQINFEQPLGTIYNMEPFSYTKQDIFQYMQDYFQ